MLVVAQKLEEASEKAKTVDYLVTNIPAKGSTLKTLSQIMANVITGLSGMHL